MLTSRDKLIILAAALVALIAGLMMGAVAAHSDGFGRYVFHAYPKSQMRMRGTLFNDAGTPAPGVPVQITVRPFAPGPTIVYNGATDGRGRYALTVPRGPSRLITVAAAGGSQVTREIVAPSLWLTVHPLRHGAVRFTGGVLAAQGYPPPTITLQDRTPSGWRTFGAVNPSPRSHLWRYVYRHVSGRQRLVFRAASLPTPAWAPATSRPKGSTVG